MKAAAASVIVPARNAAATLPRCLESLLAQDFPGLEILVADDASTDATAGIAEGFARRDARVRCIRLERQGGVKAARMAALAASTGGLVTFADADDWLEPQAISSMAAAMEAAGADAACAGLVRDSAGGSSRISRLPACDTGDALIIAAAPSDAFNALTTKLFRRHLLDGIEDDPAVSLGEDLVVTAQALHKAGRIAVLDGAFYHYCENPSSVTHAAGGRRRVEDLARVGGILRGVLKEPAFDAFHDRLSRDALLLMLRHRVFDRALWRSIRAQMKGPLLADPRHGIAKKGALACARCIFD